MNQLKKIFVFLFGLLFLFSPAVSAHTGLESSSPADGDTVKEPINNLSLTFETPIEQGSSFTLKNETGEVSLENVQVQNNVLSGSAAEPLKNGSYTVDWRIVGEDGHLIEGTYRFTVAAEPAEEPAEEAAPEEEATTDQTEEQPAADVQQEENGSSSSMPIIIGVIVAAALLAVILLMRKGKK